MSSTQKSILGAVPSEWRVVELRDLGSWGGGKTPRKSNQEYWNGETLWVSPKDMGGSVVHRTEDHVTQVALSEENLTVYDPGSVMVVFRSGVLRHTFPVATCKHPFTVNQDMKVLSPGSEVDKRFAFHLIDHLGPVVLQKATKVGTTVESVDTDSFMSLSVGVPRLDEQRRIADVLDTVDAAIQETDRVVEKQEQVKTGLLQDLLTRGLNANGRLRDPEREPEAFRETELGLLPDQWSVCRFEKLIAQGPQNGLYKPKSAYTDGEHGFPIVRIDSFYGGKLTERDDLRRLELTESERRKYGLEPDDILVNRVNSTGFIGKNAIVPALDEPTVFESNIMRLKVDESAILPKFLNGLMNTPIVLRQLQQRAKDAVAQSSINQQDVKGCLIPVPGLHEQKQIVKRIKTEESAIDEERAYKAKLQSIKTGLMQDLLTGRVRVPEAEAHVDEVVA